MLFSHALYLARRNIRICRKEKDSFLVTKNMSNISIITREKNDRMSPSFYQRRASICTSLSGSITVEAALAIPFFFFTIICVIYLMEIMSIEMSVRIGMHYAIEEIVGEIGSDYYMSDAQIEASILQGIGEEKIDNSIVVGGSQGLDCSGSYISILDGTVELEVVYEVELPISIWGFPNLYFQESMRAKGWTGYQSGVTSDSDDIVYITDNGEVYHVDYDCTYLQLSISTTTYGEVGALRNGYLGSYTPCELCVEQEKVWTHSEIVYVAEYGDHYHSTLSCSGLTRSIYAVSLSEVIGKGVCSRCGF